jgi:hypothetical protein
MTEAPPKSSNCPLNAQGMPVSEPARTNPSPTAADAIEDEVQEALAICGGDAVAALRITLLANAFLEAENRPPLCRRVIRLRARQGYKGAHVERG